MPMRLADFILANIEPILVEWECFARGIWPGPATDPVTLRDHAADILRATAEDMRAEQTPRQQSDKSKGEGTAGTASDRVDHASVLHARGRVNSGFDLMEMVSEYRALRGSVIELWRESTPSPEPQDLQDLTRFNESIDQSLTEAVRSYTEMVDRSRQMFLAILGHDLRNPLNAVRMSAAVLTRRKTLDADSSELAGGIAASADAMAKIITDLLDFTGAGLGAQMPLSPAPVDLGKLGQEVVDEMRAGYAGRTFDFRPKGDLAGEWDPARLRQVISNLLGNAVQHGAGTGPVELAMTGEGADVVFTVRNEGDPIPPDALLTIFDPLVRGSPERRQQRRPGSIGLGLYIAREVVTSHGGTIDVRSDAAATVFTVRLPRRRARA